MSATTTLEPSQDHLATEEILERLTHAIAAAGIVASLAEDLHFDPNIERALNAAEDMVASLEGIVEFEVRDSGDQGGVFFGVKIHDTRAAGHVIGKDGWRLGKLRNLLYRLGELTGGEFIRFSLNAP